MPESFAEKCPQLWSVYCQGAPVDLTHNFCVANGFGHHSEGILHSIVLTEDQDKKLKSDLRDGSIRFGEFYTLDLPPVAVRLSMPPRVSDPNGPRRIVTLQQSPLNQDGVLRHSKAFLGFDENNREKY